MMMKTCVSHEHFAPLYILLHIWDIRYNEVRMSLVHPHTSHHTEIDSDSAFAKLIEKLKREKNPAARISVDTSDAGK